MSQAARDLDLHENVLRSGASAGPRPRRRGLSQHDGLWSVIADSILDRHFTAEAPNQRWVADFARIWAAEGGLYVRAAS